MELLATLTDSQLLREVIQALAQTTARATHVPRERLVQEVLLRVREPLGWQPDVQATAEQFQMAYGEFRPDPQTHHQTRGEAPDVLRIESILWELVARGIVYPRFNAVNPTRPEDGRPYVIQHLVVTPRGRRVLEQQTASPYHDEWVQKVCGALTDLPDDIPRRLQDARDCLVAHVLRPSVIMAGLACERAIASVYEHCNLESKVSSSLQPNKKRPPNAKLLLEGLIEVANKLQPRPDGIDSLTLHLADLVRQDRNAAGHGWMREFEDSEEVELILAAAARSISTLWSWRGLL